MRRWVWVLSMAGAAACGSLDHSDYVDARADAACRKIQSCELGRFESDYRDLDDCVDEVGDAIDESDDNLPNSCDYDGEEARRCVSRINSMNCEDWAEGDVIGACDLVWDCNGN